jgi:hypothetical protein
MAYDLLALQHFYGANASTRATDTTYTFTTTDVFSPGSGSSGYPGSRFGTAKNMLWDAGGTDTLDLQALPASASGYRIDIQPGGWIAATSAYNSVNYDGTSYKVTNAGTRIPIAGSIIENVVVSGSSDAIFVNASANTISGYTPGVTTGSDTINGSNQTDTLDLSMFLESAVVKTQVGNDLVLSLGGSTGSVTIKDYYASPTTNRIAVIYKQVLPLPTLAIAALAADRSEGNSGSTSFTFTVNRSGDLTVASTAFWAVTGSGGNPAAATDFTGGTLPTGTIGFAAGEATKTVTVDVAGDTAIESDEGFTVTLSAPTGAVLGTPVSAAGLIQNDDVPPLPVVVIGALSTDKLEGTGGSTPYTFTVTRTGDLATVSSVSWAVTGSGAAAATGADFVGNALPAGSVSFGIGESAKTVTVTVLGDATIELDEGFTVGLSAPYGAVLGASAAASATIRNDDLPAVSITDAVVIEGHAGLTGVTLTISLSAPALAPVSVAYTTVDGTATLANADFVAATGVVSFAPGETSKVITVTVQGDSNAEEDEAFQVLLVSPVGATLAKVAGTVTIRNDDLRSRVSLVASDAVKFEGSSGRTPFTFTVVRAGSLDGDVTVGWAVTGTGVRPADRFDFIGGLLPSGTVRLGAGRAGQTFTVNVLCDQIAEFTEQFLVTIVRVVGNAVGPATSGTTALGTISNDDAGTPRPAAAATLPSQSFARLGATDALAAQAIAAQSFAMLGNATGSLSTGNPKRSPVK